MLAEDGGRVPGLAGRPDPGADSEPILAFRSWLHDWASADDLSSAPESPPATRDHAHEAARAVQQAREALAAGDRQRAWSILERDLRAGGWGEADVWAQLVALTVSPDDREAVRRLWLASRPRAHRAPGVMAAVAAAACAAGEHHEARTLLRKAVLQAHRLRHGQYGPSDPRLRLPITRPDHRDGDTESTTTAAYFDLLEAVMSGDEAATAAHIDRLRSLEEGDWLDRL